MKSIGFPQAAAVSRRAGTRIAVACVGIALFARCRLVDPVTGKLQSEDLNAFHKL
jgi:hypothetical protein